MQWILDAPTIAAIETALSPNRLDTYYRIAGGDKEQGIRLYAWNTALCEAFYPSLQALEIVVRNAFAGELERAWGEAWFLGATLPLEALQQQQLAVAAQDVGRAKGTVRGPDLIAALTFGFWTGILGRKYENTLWRKHLRMVFRPPSGTLLRKDVHRVLDGARLLRNRIAHHEPILGSSDLLERHNAQIELLSWISPEAGAWARNQSRLPMVWNQVPKPNAP